MMTRLLLLLLLLVQTHSFAPVVQLRRSAASCWAEPPDDDDDDDDGLILTGDAVAKEMSSLRSKYPTAESDYLAAARARSAAKTESVDCAASDDDWNSIRVAQEKATGKTINAFDDPSQGGSDSEGQESNNMLIAAELEGDGEDPKLMLF